MKTKADKPVKFFRDYAALVIGESDYRHWPKLPGAIKDAKEVPATMRCHAPNGSDETSANSG